MVFLQVHVENYCYNLGDHGSQKRWIENLISTEEFKPKGNHLANDKLNFMREILFNMTHHISLNIGDIRRALNL